jgi:hypothetical protein
VDFFSRRCFFRAMPLLPGHKLAFRRKGNRKSEGEKEGLGIREKADAENWGKGEKDDRDF